MVGLPKSLWLEHGNMLKLSFSMWWVYLGYDVFKLNSHSFFIGALPSDYLSTDESDNCNVEVPVKTAETDTKDESATTEGEGESTEPMIGQITFVSCATGSEDTNSLPPVNSNSPPHSSQDNINSGKGLADNYLISLN